MIGSAAALWPAKHEASGQPTRADAEAEDIRRQRVRSDADELPERTGVLRAVRPRYASGVGNRGKRQAGEWLTMIEGVRVPHAQVGEGRQRHADRWHLGKCSQHLHDAPESHPVGVDVATDPFRSHQRRPLAEWPDVGDHEPSALLREPVPQRIPRLALGRPFRGAVAQRAMQPLDDGAEVAGVAEPDSVKELGDGQRRVGGGQRGDAKEIGEGTALVLLKTLKPDP